MRTELCHYLSILGLAKNQVGNLETYALRWLIGDKLRLIKAIRWSDSILEFHRWLAAYSPIRILCFKFIIFTYKIFLNQEKPKSFDSTKILKLAFKNSAHGLSMKI